MLIVRITVFLCSLAFIKAIIGALRRRTRVPLIDPNKQLEADRVFDDKIKELKNEQQESMDKEQVLRELNRYRHLN